MKRIGVAVCLLAVVLTGCGKQKADNVERDYAGLTETPSSVTALEEQAVSVPDTVSDIVTGDENIGTVVIDANVSAEYISDCNAYEATCLVVDDTYLKDLAASIFDDGKYEAVMPYEVCDADELSREQSFLEELLANETEPETKSSVQLFEVAYFMEENRIKVERTVVGKAEGSLIKEIEYMPEFDWEEPIPMQYETCRLRGNYDGVPCELYYFHDSMDSVLRLLPYVQDAVYGSVVAYEGTSYDGNLCDFEDAKKQAEELLGRFPKQKLTVAAYDARHYLTEDGYVTDGYRFYCVLAAGDTPNIYFGNKRYNANASDGVSKSFGAAQSMVTIDINRYGMCQIEFPPCVYEFGACEKKTLCSFDEMYEAAKQYMQTAVNKWIMGQALVGYAAENTEITEIAFGHITVCKDGSYANLPVWMFYAKDESVSFVGSPSDGLVPKFAVDAADGMVYEVGMISPPLMFPYDMTGNIDNKYTKQ